MTAVFHGAGAGAMQEYHAMGLATPPLCYAAQEQVCEYYTGPILRAEKV